MPRHLPGRGQTQLCANETGEVLFAWVDRGTAGAADAINSDGRPGRLWRGATRAAGWAINNQRPLPMIVRASQPRESGQLDIIGDLTLKLPRQSY